MVDLTTLERELLEEKVVSNPKADNRVVQQLIQMKILTKDELKFGADRQEPYEEEHRSSGARAQDDMIPIVIGTLMPCIQHMIVWDTKASTQQKCC